MEYLRSVINENRIDIHKINIPTVINYPFTEMCILYTSKDIY